jgi:membrane protease YdiL (CAAX protease family)
VQTRIRIITFAFLSEIALLGAALFCVQYFRIDIPPLTDHVPRDLLISIAGSVPPLALFFFIVSKKAAQLSLLKGMRNIVLHDVRNIFSHSRLIDLIMISLAAGIAEELLFRGVLQSKFGIVPSSILFGLVHFISPLYMIITAVMGFYLGAFLYMYDNLTIPVMIHFFYDLGALVYLRFYVNNGNAD